MNNDIQISPVVSVLGHVDHGKTTLLDAIRKTNIAGGEFGGITQAIGASEIETIIDGKKRKITFIDTPGHEAFSKMRGRGSNVADVGLLIISSTDGIMPQTIESAKLLKNAKIPFIVVFTKSDLPGNITAQIKQQLLKEEIVLDEFGGEVPSISVSAKTNENIDKLLSLIILVFDLNYKNPNEVFEKPFRGIIIESKLDSKAGPKVTMVVKSGKISKGEIIWAGKIKCKIKALINPRGIQVNEILAGGACEVLGFDSVPEVGSTVAKTETEAFEIVNKAKDIGENEPILSIILSADTKGSLEAIINSLPPEIAVILAKTGEVSENDINFAKSTKSIVLSFNNKIRSNVIKLAKTEKVLVKNYSIIYEMLDELQEALKGKKLEGQEEILGVARIQGEFTFDKKKVCGILVEDGRIAKGDKIRLIRGEEVVGEANITSLRIGKDVATKVEKNKEAGIILSPQLDFSMGDVILSYS